MRKTGAELICLRGAPPMDRQQEIADREAMDRSARVAAANASTQRQAECGYGDQPTNHWWLHPRDFADNPSRP